MKINWKIRFKNKTFLLSFVAVILSFVYQILGIFYIVPKISQEQTTQIAVFVVNILVGLGVVIDPTTPGAKDSDRAMNYK